MFENVVSWITTYCYFCVAVYIVVTGASVLNIENESTTSINTLIYSDPFFSVSFLLKPLKSYGWVATCYQYLKKYTMKEKLTYYSIAVGQWLFTELVRIDAHVSRQLCNMKRYTVFPENSVQFGVSQQQDIFLHW